MITIRIFLLVVVFTMLTGCVSLEERNKIFFAEQEQRRANENSVREALWRDAYFGEKLDDSLYLTAVENSLKSSLIDPDSLKLACDDARKGWAKKSRLYFGWIVQCKFNAKNRYGGYTGAKPIVFLFKEENILVTDSLVFRGTSYDFNP